MRTAREVWECGEWRGRERERGKEAHYKRCAFSPMTESQNGKYFCCIYYVYILLCVFCIRQVFSS